MYFFSERRCQRNNYDAIRGTSVAHYMQEPQINWKLNMIIIKACTPMNFAVIAFVIFVTVTSHVKIA